MTVGIAIFLVFRLKNMFALMVALRKLSSRPALSEWFETSKYVRSPIREAHDRVLTPYSLLFRIQEDTAFRQAMALVLHARIRVNGTCSRAQNCVIGWCCSLLVLSLDVVLMQALRYQVQHTLGSKKGPWIQCDKEVCCGIDAREP